MKNRTDLIVVEEELNALWRELLCRYPYGFSLSSGEGKSSLAGWLELQAQIMRDDQ